MTDAKQEPLRCRSPKRGGIDLTCELDDGHEGWHKAVCTERREIVYQGAHHVAEHTETVTWEPLNLAGELTRRLTQAVDP